MDGFPDPDPKPLAPMLPWTITQSSFRLMHHSYFRVMAGTEARNPRPPNPCPTGTASNQGTTWAWPPLARAFPA